MNVKLDPSGWLRNFDDAQRPYAVSLLNNFLYFSKQMTEAMFSSGFANLGPLIYSDKSNAGQCKAEWLAFLSQVVVVRVTGETPSDTDSGYIFARMARDVLGIPESQILSPPDALELAMAKPDAAIVFVDDFVGSGTQFITMWHRPMMKAGSVVPPGSFSALKTPASGQKRLFYIPLVCTADGMNAIALNCRHVTLRPVHVLTSRYSALEKSSIFWNDDPSWPQPIDALRRISLSVGLSESSGAIDDWRGFFQLGTAIAFEHGAPDSNLGILSWDKGGWTPLLRR